MLTNRCIQIDRSLMKLMMENRISAQTTIRAIRLAPMCETPPPPVIVEPTHPPIPVRRFENIFPRTSIKFIENEPNGAAL